MEIFERFFIVFLLKLKQHWFNLFISAIVVLISLISTLIFRKLFSNAAKKFKTPLPPHIVKIVKNLISLAIFTVCALIILKRFNISVGPIFTMFSSIILSLSLAMQEMLNSAVKGIQIKISKPFSVGDLIQVGNIKGTVKQINFLNTVISNSDGTSISISNKTIMDGQLINLSKNQSANLNLNAQQNLVENLNHSASQKIILPNTSNLNAAINSINEKTQHFNSIKPPETKNSSKDENRTIS